MKAKVLALLTLSLFFGILIIIALFTKLAIYVSIIALGLALALQKYIASYFGYFYISFSHIFSIGDRIRIGTIKGDVRQIGLFHFVLEEVGEDEKLGGELTGRILHIPNLIVLDQPVLNFSKSYTVGKRAIGCEFIFDEIRLPLTPQSNLAKAISILEEILKEEDKLYLEQAKSSFNPDFPDFVEEAEKGPRIIVHIEPQKIWLKGKFITPFKQRNEMRTKILLRFLQKIENDPQIRLA